jgi:Ca2+-binding EF-hand superfamily protein
MSFNDTTSYPEGKAEMTIRSVRFHAIFASVLLSAAAAAAAPRGDTDGDGKLSLREFQTQIVERQMRADKNGDGKISLDEWLARPATGKMKEDPTAVFKQRDTNGDGFIDAAETEAGAKGRFERLDANHDGVLSEEEWSARRNVAAKSNADGAATDEDQPAGAGTVKN